jgi:hypothetical protein
MKLAAAMHVREQSTTVQRGVNCAAAAAAGRSVIVPAGPRLRRADGNEPVSPALSPPSSFCPMVTATCRCARNEWPKCRATPALHDEKRKRAVHSEGEWFPPSYYLGDSRS